MRAIIGPNGAGKTTMMDVITGKTRPDAATSFFDGRRSTSPQLDETEIAELGIGRKFQKPTVFESHTVENNLELALKATARARSTLFWRAQRRRQRDRIDEILDTIRLTPTRATALAGALSHGQKQWLEIGMLLAQEPKLLLVDEPVAGMTDAETDADRRAAAARSTATQHRGRGRARHGLRARARRQGHGAARRHGAGRRLDRPGAANERVIEVYLGR